MASNRRGSEEPRGVAIHCKEKIDNAASARARARAYDMLALRTYMTQSTRTILQGPNRTKHYMPALMSAEYSRHNSSAQN